MRTKHAVLPYTTEPSRIDRLRDTACRALDDLMDALDEDRHDADCVLRCLASPCDDAHACSRCADE